MNVVMKMQLLGVVWHRFKTGTADCMEELPCLALPLNFSSPPLHAHIKPSLERLCREHLGHRPKAGWGEIPSKLQVFEAAHRQFLTCRRGVASNQP